MFCDEFTNFNDLKAGIATVELLELLGYEVQLPDHAESGRASLSKGLVRRGKRFANENVRQLSSIVSAEEPLIGIEPSAILGFRDEYPALVDPALRESAAALILVHNHPSGDPDPSPEDLEVTWQLVESGRLLGIPVRDHIIIGDGRFISLLERGLVPGAGPEVALRSRNRATS